MFNPKTDQTSIDILSQGTHLETKVEAFLIDRKAQNMSKHMPKYDSMCVQTRALEGSPQPAPEETIFSDERHRNCQQCGKDEIERNPRPVRVLDVGSSGNPCDQCNEAEKERRSGGVALPRV